MIGAIYNEQDLTPTQDGEMWMKKFKNGTVISHDRKTGDVIVSTKGHLTATAQGGATINADTIVNGSLHATGKITSDKEISAPTVNKALWYLVRTFMDLARDLPNTPPFFKSV
ncbi:Phage P2 baseplate assembly protein gpV [Actinobacillus equuli]|nr:Phage P2 baseplate assembly protein gpV [Actinobacillus equuli]